MKILNYISIICLGAGLVACTAKHTTIQKKSPAKVEAKQNGENPVVVLSKDAEERLGIATVNPTASQGRYSIPSSGILYDVDGSAWIYVRLSPLSYQRVAISLNKVDRAVAQLHDTLTPEMEIVTAGAAELYGTETGGGK